MNPNEIRSHIDHTLLKQTAVWEQIKKVCEEGIANQTASVCIPPSYVKQASDFVKKKIPICTVIGFPNGYQTSATKVFEAADAVENGADEIDMVINLGWVKDGLFDAVEEEINAVKKACSGKVLKVIIETCMLTEKEKIKLCHVISHSDADFIKTSTGFGSEGATPNDVKLFADMINPKTKIKAAGGIKSVADAEYFLKLGAERLGTSSLLGMLQEM